MGKDLLDMSQYFKMLGTCRIPGVTRDSIVYHGQSDNPPKHIVVAHNNHVSSILYHFTICYSILLNIVLLYSTGIVSC